MIETALELCQKVPAPREKVFAAWTDPEQLKKWFAPNEAFQVPEASVDLKVGGRYRIQMLAPDGGIHTAHGEYLEIVPPEKLVFTWGWEGNSEFPKNTRVTVKFVAQGQETEVQLRHEWLPNAGAKRLHGEGWTGSLDRLQKFLD